MTPDLTGATELRLRTAVECAPSGLLMTDARGNIVLVNREVERLFGYAREEMLGRPVEMLLPERYRAGHVGARGVFLAGPRVRAMGAGRELFGRRKDGVEVPLEIGLTPVATSEGMYVLAAVVDITARRDAEEERRRLEDELRQAQKLEAVGTLAAGIAHDFANILFGISGYAELLAKAPMPERARADLAELMRATKRGRDLIERILVFARPDAASRQPIDIGPTVAEAARLLRAILPAAIDVRVDVHPRVPRILGDETAIHEVLVNLGTNAANAMPAGGVLWITVEPRYLRDSAVRSHAGLHEGEYVVLSVRDHGVGMDASVREHAFDPFFTTQPQGRGSGLGLAMVHTLVRGHEGVIDLASQPGEGTTVTCYFPALPQAPAEERRRAAEAPAGRGERVLLVENEPALADMNGRRLAELGYRVTAERDAFRALERFRESPESFDVVLTDHLMPRLQGLELAREVRAVRPETPVLLLTGYLEHLGEEAVRAAGVRRVLHKPVTLVELGTALRRVLDTRAAPEPDGARPGS